MSDLLNQASLVMVPSGYKEDTVYSVVPTDGSGDLSFTRASNGTRVNSAGLVEVCPWNLAQYSEDFSNAYWGTTNSSITANSTTAPNGTTTADTLTRNAGTAYLYNGSFNLGIGQFTQSVYAKANASSSIRLEFVTGAFGRGAACIFDLSNGTAGTITIYGGVSGFTATIESVGDGWYRCSLGGTITIADTYYWEISITTGSIYIWGAQLNIGSTAKPYFPTTDRLNVPRLTYQNGGGGCPSLLLEKQSTNQFTYSEDFTNSIWNKTRSTITANATTSPDGTQNADTYVDGTYTNNVSFIDLPYSASGVATTFSIFVKKGTANYVVIGVYDGASNNIVVDTNTWTISTTIGSFTTTKIESYGNGWYRLSVTKTLSGSCYPNFSVSNNSTWANYNGDGTLTAYYWGAQIENSSYATSYIPTTSSSATRVADYAYKTSATALIGQSEGTLFADFVTGGLPSIDQYYMNISDGSTSNIVYIGFYANILVARVIDAGSLVVNINVALATNTRYKVGFAYKANDCILYINGSNSGSDTSASIPACSKLSYNDFSYEACYQLNESVLFKTRLSNAELASLTTI